MQHEKKWYLPDIIIRLKALLDFNIKKEPVLQRNQQVRQLNVRHKHVTRTSIGAIINLVDFVALLMVFESPQCILQV